MASRVLAVFVALWLWPGTGEAAEYAIHWLQDGDAVHGQRHHEPAPDDQDGCPDASHLCHLSSCSCWSTTTPVAAVTLLPPPHVACAPLPAPIAHLGCGDPAPLTRPPIA